MFHTFSRAFVRSSLVHERGGPPRGAECCPFELRPKMATINLGLELNHVDKIKETKVAETL